jgi:hypothetical protein
VPDRVPGLHNRVKSPKLWICTHDFGAGGISNYSVETVERACGGFSTLHALSGRTVFFTFFSRCPLAIVMIDDFEVPPIPGVGLTTMGQGRLWFQATSGQRYRRISWESFIHPLRWLLQDWLLHAGSAVTAWSSRRELVTGQFWPQGHFFLLLPKPNSHRHIRFDKCAASYWGALRSSIALNEMASLHPEGERTAVSPRRRARVIVDIAQ